MDCPHCENDIPDNSLFCNLCGGRTRIIRIEQTRIEQTRTHFRPLTAVLAVGLLIILIVVIGSRVGNFYTSNRIVPQAMSLAAPAAPTPQWQHKVAPHQNTIAIEPRGYKSHELSVPSEFRNFRVRLKFRAEGGSGNDVMVYLLDEESFVNWQNGHNYLQYYESGKVTVGSLDVRLKPGKYFMIFSNKMSMFSNKVVHIDSTIEFDVLQ